MKATNHFINDTVITIYVMNKGDKVPRHIHAYEHTTVCLSGKTKVEVEGKPLFYMLPGQGDVYLPENVFHEVTALEDGTVAMHCFDKKYLGIKAYPPANFTPDNVRAGVLMEDGTIEYPDED
jgi:quercetin dioxygenase-like cupin family protein